MKPTYKLGVSFASQEAAVTAAVVSLAVGECLTVHEDHCCRSRDYDECSCLPTLYDPKGEA